MSTAATATSSFRATPLLPCIAIGALIWLIPCPAGLSLQGWRLLALFTSTIAGIILRPLPMGAVAFIGMTLIALTGILPLPEVLSAYSNPVVWLVLSAFFIAKGFLNSGLATRMAYGLLALLGKRTLGLGYGIVLADLCLSPAIPSDTARSGGIVLPILRGIVESSDRPRLAAFLTLSAFQGSILTSSLFLTAMASNPLVSELSRSLGYPISWGLWTLAALVPGLLSLLIIPALLYRLHPPEQKATPEASRLAKEQLKGMGKFSRQEGITLTTLLLLLAFWIGGSYLGISPTLAAMAGFVLLLLSGVLSWEDVTSEGRAWETFVWFAALIMMATGLQTLGVTDWLGSAITGKAQGLSWKVAFPLLALLYFFSHYLFAGNTSHISAFFVPFAAIAIGLGTPPMLALLTLAFFSCLFAGTTHYGTAAAPLLYGTGYVDVRTWWKVGLACALVNIVIWGVVGSFWWKVLGLW